MKTINAKGKMENAKWKILRFAICTLQFAISVSACSPSFQVGGEIQAGRLALMIGKSDVALNHFRSAADLDPNYILDFSPFQEGVWAYVGRAYYESGKFSESRQALEKSIARYQYDYLGRLYLGLVLARDGNRERGLQEMQGGLRGLHQWLEDITYNTTYGQFWDPLREIRSQIERSLVALSGREFDLKTIIAEAEWVGKTMEDEIDKARRDESNERMRQGEGRDGGGQR